MFKIGPFSRLSQVSVKTLRFYDEIGLLRPMRVDGDNGYRYYAAHQLPRLHRILALKDLGFTLEQIAPLLKANLSAEQLRELLQGKRAEIQKRMDDERSILARVEARLSVIEQEGSMSQYEVVIKRVEPIRVAAIREILPKYSAVGDLFGEIMGVLGQAGVRPAGPCIAVWHDNGYKESDVDGSACVVVEASARFTGNERVKVYDLPAVETALSVIHHGPYATLHDGYNALFTWANANGYEIIGENREIYLESKGDGSQMDESCVTEIQFAAAKV